VTAGRDDQEGALGVVLAFHIDEIFVQVGMPGEEFVDVNGLGVIPHHGVGVGVTQLQLTPFQ